METRDMSLVNNEISDDDIISAVKENKIEVLHVVHHNKDGDDGIDIAMTKKSGYTFHITFKTLDIAMQGIFVYDNQQNIHIADAGKDRIYFYPRVNIGSKEGTNKFHVDSSKDEKLKVFYYM